MRRDGPGVDPGGRGPATLALCHIRKLQPRQLPSPKAAPHQQPQQDPVPQALLRGRIGRVQELLGLLQGQPVAGPDAGAPGTPRIPVAATGESPPWAAAAAASLRRAASATRCER